MLKFLDHEHNPYILTFPPYIYYRHIWINKKRVRPAHLLHNFGTPFIIFMGQSETPQGECTCISVKYLYYNAKKVLIFSILSVYEREPVVDAKHFL